MKINNMAPVYIGDEKIDFPVGLSPMAGITDRAFREVCSIYKAGFLVSEMVSCKALLHQNRKTWDMIKVSGDEGKVGLQLFGSDPTLFAKVIKEVNDTDFTFFDINMGCPAPKIVKNNEGSALMKDPKLVYEIIKKAVSVSKKPVTVKIRKGYSKGYVNGVEIAQIAEKAGAAAVFVHGRTRDQMYAGQADWGFIKEVKDALAIPVFGNGDVVDVQSANELYESTGCDGILIGRGARGNPWIFEAILHGNPKLKKKYRSPEEKMKVIKKHIALHEEYKEERNTVLEMRKHISWYLKDEPHGAAARKEINQATSIEEMITLIEKVYTNSLSM